MGKDPPFGGSFYVDTEVFLSGGGAGERVDPRGFAWRGNDFLGTALAGDQNAYSFEELRR